MEMGSAGCCSFMHFFTPMTRDQTNGVKAKLQRKVPTPSDMVGAMD
jgi:hypothetical protein